MIDLNKQDPDTLDEEVLCIDCAGFKPHSLAFNLGKCLSIDVEFAWPTTSQLCYRRPIEYCPFDGAITKEQWQISETKLIDFLFSNLVENVDFDEEDGCIIFTVHNGETLTIEDSGYTHESLILTIRDARDVVTSYRRMKRDVQR
jgi:hypothetical protein